MTCGQDFHIRCTSNGWFYIENPKGDKLYAGGVSWRQVGEFFDRWALDCLKEKDSEQGK